MSDPTPAEKRAKTTALRVLLDAPGKGAGNVSDERESMPAKSTFFHPKLPSGLVIHPLVD